MAEKQFDAAQDGFGSVADTQDEVNSSKQTPKRCPSSSPTTAPPHKSPRTGVPSPVAQASDAGEGHSKTDEQEMQTENMEGLTSPATSPSTRRKSWRRATLTRRSLSALPINHLVLCRNISTSLSHQERLDKLMEASMRLAIEKTLNSLQSVPKASLETFHQQVELMQKEWGFVAKSIRGEPQDHRPPACTTRSSDPSVQRDVEKVRKAIKRLQGECESWESLLNKHRSKAEELKSKVEQVQGTGISLESAPVVQSSQHHLIQSKPDYHSLLCRQQPILDTMAMIMDTQCKMVRELLVIKEQSQSLVKETSGRLAAEAGFQDLSPDPIRNLMAVPLSSETR